MPQKSAKAGSYQLVANRFDQTISKPGEPWRFERYVKGEIVELDSEDAQRLLDAGAVREPGVHERETAERLAVAAAAAKVEADNAQQRIDEARKAAEAKKVSTPTPSAPPTPKPVAGRA